MNGQAETVKRMGRGKSFILNVLRGLLILLPLAAYLYINLHYGADSAFVVVGVFGTLFVGAGLFLLLNYLFGKKRAGLLLPFGLIFIGGLLITMSELFLFCESFHGAFEEKAVNFYFISLIFMIVPCVIYPLFRSDLSDYAMLKSGLDEENFKKEKEEGTGLANLLWMKDFNKAHKLGAPYYLNIVFTLLFGIDLLVLLFAGYMRAASYPVMLMSLFIYLSSFLMTVFSSCAVNIQKYGKPFVLFERDEKTGSRDTSFKLVIWLCFWVAIGYIHVMFASQIWSFI